MNPEKITVIGDGGWGTALALVLLRNGHDVTLWGPFEDYINETRAKRENVKFLPGVTLPENLKLTADRKVASEASAFVLVVPTKFSRAVLESFKDFIPKEADLITASKGFDKETHKIMSDTAEEILSHACVAALSGPSHAEEVARGGMPAAVTIAAHDAAVAARWQNRFNAATFRVYTCSDVIGVELGGAMKNVIAVAAGISDGIGFGDNTKAALITRGLAEMMRLGEAMGAQPQTFSGLSGIGDLIVTCASKLSRNRAVGERLGKGETIDEIAASMDQVAEGVWTCQSAVQIAEKYGIEAPIAQEAYNVIYNKKDPRKAVEDLLSRDVKAEH